MAGPDGGSAELAGALVSTGGGVEPPLRAPVGVGGGVVPPDGRGGGSAAFARGTGGVIPVG